MSPTLTDALAVLHRPNGRRLGILAHPDTPAETLRAAEATLVAAGEEPVRRLAVLQPAPGAATLRTDELTYFIRRFGHEYTVVLCPADLPGIDAVHAASTEAGCAVHAS